MPEEFEEEIFEDLFDDEEDEKVSIDLEEELKAFGIRDDDIEKALNPVEIKEKIKIESKNIEEIEDPGYIFEEICGNCGEKKMVSPRTGFCEKCDKNPDEKKPKKKKSAPKKKSVKKEPETKTIEIKDEIANILEESTSRSEIIEKVANKEDFELDLDQIIKNEESKETILAKKTEEKKSIIFNMDSHPIIILLWGYDGTSKSEQILKFRDGQGRAPLVFDFENKLRTIAEKLGFPQENIITSGKYNQAYELDGPNTLRDFRSILETIKQRIKNDPKNIKFSAIALDGISDIRPFAKDEWLLEHPKRKNPTNPGDWSEINDKVRDVVFTMINIGRAEGIHIFLTAQVGGVYKDNVRIREVPDCKEWIWYNVDHKFKLYREDAKGKFYAYCEKSYYDPFWSIDITDFSHKEKPSLMNLLQKPKMIHEIIESYRKIQESLETEFEIEELE